MIFLQLIRPEAFRNNNGFGDNASYWKVMKSLKHQRDNVFHKKAQELGRIEWYKEYKLRICKIERDYEFII